MEIGIPKTILTRDPYIDCYVYNLIEVSRLLVCLGEFHLVIFLVLCAVCFDKFVFQILVSRKCSDQRLVEAK